MSIDHVFLYRDIYDLLIGSGMSLSLHRRGVWGNEVSPRGCGDSKEFAFYERFTLASPHDV